MQKREKTMAGVMAGVLVLFAGVQAVRSLVIAPSQQLDQDIYAAQVRREKLLKIVDAGPRTIKQWQQRTARTLSDDYAKARDLFREDIATLLDRNGLTRERTIGSLKERVEKKPPAQGFVTLPVQVRVEGHLTNLVNFLRDLYQRPYYVRIEKLTINPDIKGQAKTRKRKRSTGPQTLKITMTLSTLVLPMVEKPEGVGHPTFNLADLNDPDKAEKLLASVKRLRNQPDQYAQIARISPFEIWQPPPRPVAKATPKHETKQPPKPKPKPVVDKRRDADKWVIVGVANDGEPLAFVANSDDLTAPLREYRLNDRVDDGTLVLIVPEGIVVRTRKRIGGRYMTHDYFYEVGTNFKQRVELRPTEYPEIHKLLKLALGE